MMSFQQPSATFSGRLVTFRRKLGESGLCQIDAAIAQLDHQLASSDMSVLDSLVLTGQRRELFAARWCVKRLLLAGSESAAVPTEAPSINRGELPSLGENFSGSVQSLELLPESRPPQAYSDSLIIPSITPAISPSASLRRVQVALFDAVFAQLQGNLRNLTNTPLEIDILREDKKRELLGMVLRKLEEGLDDLRYSQVPPELLPEKQATVLVNIWQATTADFFGLYYSLPLGNSPLENLRQPPVDLVEVLLQDRAIVQSEILGKIPLVTDFLAHLLFQAPLLIDDQLCGVGTVEAMARMELLLQNLMIQVGNAVVQPLLNRFGNVVAVKQNFYDRRLLSTREIERFRNNLSWRYRVERYIGEPTAIFESRYSLFTLQSQIGKTSIYAPRSQDLDDLSGLRLAVTLTLEARDAIAPRLNSALSFLGSGVVYILTEVIGRGLGLIGRGILKGIGNSLQDNKMNKGL
jgi:hypothetical protein